MDRFIWHTHTQRLPPATDYLYEWLGCGCMKRSSIRSAVQWRYSGASRTMLHFTVDNWKWHLSNFSLWFASLVGTFSVFRIENKRTHKAQTYSCVRHSFIFRFRLHTFMHFCDYFFCFFATVREFFLFVLWKYIVWKNNKNVLIVRHDRKQLRQSHCQGKEYTAPVLEAAGDGNVSPTTTI